MSALKTEAASSGVETWSELLLYGHDRRLESITRPPLDCTGVPVMWQEPRASECAEPGPSTEPLPTQAGVPAANDVTVRFAGAGLQLVWLRIQAFSDGESEGPIALVSRQDDRLVVQAVGTLRSLPLTRLGLEDTGHARLLVAEGELCSPGESPVCQSTTRLLLLRNGRFVALPVVSREGRCLGPDWFPRHREQTYTLANGLRRRIEQTTSLEIKDDQVVVNESIDVRDLDPRQKAAIPEPFHTTRAKRTLLMQQARIVGDAPSPWAAIIERFASAGVLAPAPARPEPQPATTIPAKAVAPGTPPPVKPPEKQPTKGPTRRPLRSAPPEN